MTTNLRTPGGTPMKFTREEFACPTTGELEFAPDFLGSLHELRTVYNKPMVVTSGCRSYEHNAKLIQEGLPASPSSFHLISNQKYNCNTCALDVARMNGPDLGEFLFIAWSRSWSIGLAKTFIHLDRRIDNSIRPQTFYTY